MNETVLRPTADLSSRERSAQHEQIAKLRAELDRHIAYHRLSWPVTLWAQLRWLIGR